MSPKISVIMPLYNAEKYVKRTIECVLNQTYKDFELILIDDCSTDSTMEIVNSIKDERIKIVKNDKNRGISYSRNHGLQVAQGEYIALMDDDDLAPLERFEMEAEYLDEHPEIAVIGGGFRIINENDEFVSGITPTLQNPNYIRAEFMFYCPMYNGASMYRKSIAIEHNITYRDNCLGMEDYCFWIEYSKYGKMTNFEEAMLYWRQAPTTQTIQVLNNKVAAREKKFAELQLMAIKANNLELSDDEIKIFTDSFMELKPKIEDERSLIELYRVLKKMINQANDKRLVNATEIMQACRNRFLEKVKNSNIWK